MAGDLIEQSGIRHTFAHDLESFFWVLMWIVLTRVRTNYDDATRSNFIHVTMGAHVCSEFGGSHKTVFLTSPRMLKERYDRFELPGNATLARLLVELKRTVADRYHGLPEEISSTELAQSVNADYVAQQTNQLENEAPAAAADPKERGLMKSHRVVNGLFANSLTFEWPRDDKAEVYPILPLSSVVDIISGSKRSRSVIGYQLSDDNQRSMKRQA
jgi:hypothetical protein